MQSGSGTPFNRIALPLLLVGVIVSLSILHIQTVQFFCDDAYITFRYAQNLADGHGPVYNPGERVEGYTNFLWMILIAAALKTGASAEGASLALGIFFLAITQLFAVTIARRLLPRPGGWCLLPGIFLATLGPFILWSVCGLETIFFTAAVCAAFLQYHRAGTSRSALFSAGLLYALAALIRPEGALFGAVAGLHLLGERAVRAGAPPSALLQRAASLAAGFATLFLPFLIWRYSYYGDWLPNTFYVKAAEGSRFALGGRYLLSFATEYPGLVLLSIIGIPVGILRAAGRASRSIVVHITLILAVLLASIAWMGGDYMALYRFHAPLLPFAALLAAITVYHTYGFLRKAWKGPALFPIVLLIAVTGSLGGAFYAPSIASARGEKRSGAVAPLRTMKRNTSLWVAAGKALAEQVWPDAVIATSAAGALPYFSGLATIDQSGLSDRHTARVEWDPWIADKPGHGKIARKSYILERSPDIIVGHPRIAREGKLGPSRVTWPRYVLRGIPISIEGGPGPSGLHLYFWLRRDLYDRGEEHGFLIPPAPGSVPR